MLLYKYVRSFSRLQRNYRLFSQFYKNNPTISHVYYDKSFKLRTAHYVVNFCSISDNNRKISEAFANLDTSYKQQIRIYRNDIELLAKSIENEDILNEDNYILLFHCCGHLMPDELPSSRITLAENAWKILLKKKVVLTVEHYNSLLRCYIENRKILSHKEFLANMICDPNDQTLNLLLECVSENGDIEQAVDIVNIMKHKGIAVNEPVFSSLILCHLRCGDVKSAQNMLDTMRIAQITPTSNTYVALLRGYVESNNIEEFKSTLKHAANREFNVKQIILILYSVSLSENLELLPLIKESWSSRIDTRTFGNKLTSLCTHLIFLNKPLVAHEIYKCFVDPDMGFVSESDTYESVLLYEMIRSNTPSDIIIKIVNDLIKTERNIYAMFKAAEIALKIPDTKLSIILLTAMHQSKTVLRNHYFWPVLLHEAKKNGEIGIFEIFFKMCECNVKIDSETLDTYSLRYIANLDADIMINRLKQFNLRLTESITPISTVLMQQGKIKEVVDLTSKYNLKLNGRSNIIKILSAAFINSGDVTNTIAILNNIVSKDHADDFEGQLLSTVIARSGKSKNQQILNLLRAYKTDGIKISVNAMDKIAYLLRKFEDNEIKNKIQNIVNSLDSLNNDEVNNHIPHPRNMSLEELECHLIELRQKNMETRGLLRKLITLHCKAGNVHRVTQLCHDFEKAGYNMSAGMNSSLLDLYIKNNNLEKALETYKTLKKDFTNFTVDDFKIIDLAKILCENKMFDEAIKLLRNESSNRKILGGPRIEANCWRLLNAISKMGDIKKTNSMFQTLIDEGYCTSSNVMLGPLVRVHMDSGNITETVEQYVNCCVKYKKTPLMHELLCHVLKKQASPELIKKVVEATAFVHSASQAETSLVAALAETGLAKPLRKLLVELSKHLNNSLLRQHCERWVKENKIDAMKTLIASAEGLTIDLSHVYLGLMRSYYANNDRDNALSLWNDMQEKHILPNNHIKEMIDNLLLNNEVSKNKQL